MSDFIHLYEPLINKRGLKHVPRACFSNKAQSRQNLIRNDIKENDADSSEITIN